MHFGLSENFRLLFFVYLEQFIKAKECPASRPFLSYSCVFLTLEVIKSELRSIFISSSKYAENKH